MGTDKEHSLNIAAIRAAIEGGLHNLERDPERGVRNMIDLGKYFSRTHRQRSFFQMAQRLLGRKRSQYMQLLKRTIAEVDHETLKTIGINMGYYSWSQGAKAIREVETERGFNVPWSIVMNVSADTEDSLTLDEINRIISEAHELGTHCFWIAMSSSEEEIISVFDILGTFKDNAFFVLLRNDLVTPNVANAALKQHNIAICLRDVDTASENVKSAAKILHDARLFYGLYYLYDDSNADDIISGHVQSDADEYHSQFALLIAAENCSEECLAKVRAYASGEKTTPERPPFMVDFFADLAAVDKIISSDQCFIAIDRCGNIASSPWAQPGDINLKTCALTDALEQLAPREAK